MSFKARNLPIELPDIQWTRNDPKEHQWFEDGSKFLVALRVKDRDRNIAWSYDVVVISTDEDSMYLRCTNGEPFDDWEWTDFEWFCTLEGAVPVKREVDEDEEHERDWEDEEYERDWED